MERAKNIFKGKTFTKNKTGKSAYIVGALGEVVVGDYLGVTPHIYNSPDDVYNYDIMYKGIKIEVKSKGVSNPPKPFYDCGVLGYNIKQKCDQYWFVNILKDLSRAFIVGYMPKDEFYKTAKFCEAGTDRGNIVYKWDNWTMKIDNLKDPKEAPQNSYT